MVKAETTPQFLLPLTLLEARKLVLQYIAD